MKHRPHLIAIAAWIATGATGATSASADTLAPFAEEVPFITTPDNVTLEMLRIAEVGPRDRVLDLGSGDGRIVITAARRFGARGRGVEIVPDLVRQSIVDAGRAGVADRVEFRVQDIFATDLADATVVTMYLLPEFNLRLRPALLALAPGTRIVSHDWDMGDWPPDRTVVVPVPDKSVGLEKSSRVHRWTVPARVDGAWCGPGGARLTFAQRYQQFDARLEAPRLPSRSGPGRIDGTALRPEAGAAALPGLDWRGGTLVVAAPAPGAPRGARFVPAAGRACPA